jgi:hypothetical protein
MAFPFSIPDWRRRRLAETDETMLPDVNPYNPYNPGGGETPPALPAPMDPRSVPMTAPAAPPGVGSPGPTPIAPQSRYGELQEAKDVYLKGTPGRFKSAALGGLRGLGPGLASGGGLAGALGGAVGGAIGGGINPRGEREMEFEERVRPKIYERFGFEDLERASARQAQTNALDDERKRAEIGRLNRPQRMNVQGLGVVDPITGEVIARAPERRAPARFEWTSDGLKDVSRMSPEELSKLHPYERPNAAQLTIDPESGLSAEEMADASYNGRGGDQYVYDHLPERTRKILEAKAGTVSPDEINAAQRDYQSAITRQRKTDLDYTKGHLRAKRINGRAAQPGATTSGKPARGRNAISVQEAGDLLRGGAGEGGRPALPTQQPPQAARPRQSESSQPGEAEARAEVERLKRESEEAGEAFKRYQSRERFHKSLYYSYPLAKMAEGINNAADWMQGVKVGDKKAADEATDKYYQALRAYTQKYGRRLLQ